VATHDVSDVNPYTPPSADIAGNGQSSDSDITCEEIVFYVGRKSAYYWREWEQPLRTGRFATGFNWAACLVTIPWLFYRKLFREVAMVLGGALLLAVLQGLLGMVVGPDFKIAERGLEVAAAVALGVLGNGLYLRRAKLVIAEARQHEPDQKRRAQLLMSRGGTSSLWAVVGVLLVFGLRLLVAFAPKGAGG
jgi:hypothetical protein